MDSLKAQGEALLRSPRGNAVRALADSPEARALEKTVSPEAVESAVRSGDGEQLRTLLHQVLSTEEGQALARRIAALGGKTDG